MRELRQDPTTRDWVVIAPDRGHRPRDLPAAGGEYVARPPAACPFCPGHETETPPELWRAPAPPGGWQVRVVPNQYPILDGAAPARRRLTHAGFLSMAAAGQHEVIIESPEHDADLARMDDAAVRAVLAAYRSRYRALRAAGAAAILVFRNHGARAGTSLAHPHSQIVGLPIVPLQVRHRCEVAMQHFDDLGTNLYLDVLRQELRDGRRILVRGEGFVAFQPFASMAPHETWIVPRVGQSAFGDATDAALDELAPILRGVLAGLEAVIGDLHYNLVIQSAPTADEHQASFVWHVRIVPRLAMPAGFELGTGMAINPTLPEETAARLRTAILRRAPAGPIRDGTG